MKLAIKSVPGFIYATEIHKFPVEIEISTDAPIEIYSRVDVIAAFLTKLDGSDTIFGYAKLVTPARRECIMLLPEEPLRMQIDVFEHDDDLEPYGSGTYRCDIKVLLGEKVGERMRPVELEGSLEAVVT
jgi:hypothetical protein